MRLGEGGVHSKKSDVVRGRLDKRQDMYLYGYCIGRALSSILVHWQFFAKRRVARLFHSISFSGQMGKGARFGKLTEAKSIRHMIPREDGSFERENGRPPSLYGVSRRDSSFVWCGYSFTRTRSGSKSSCSSTLIERLCKESHTLTSSSRWFSSHEGVHVSELRAHIMPWRI